MIPHGDPVVGNYVLRDPYGLAGTVVLTPIAAVLVSLMNGERTLGDIRMQFEQTVGQSIPLIEVENFVAQLDENHFLDSKNFAAYQQAQLADYLALAVRPAAHAGGAYHEEPEGLRAQLSLLFTCEGGPGLLPWEGNGTGVLSQDKLCGVMSPHIDFHRGGPAFAWAYDRIVTESQAKLFIILGTAHTPLQEFYSVSRKDFETPLGTVETDREFIKTLSNRLGESFSGVFQDELPHRQEHSIEFQTLMLQFVLGGRRDFRVVPILVGSFHPFVEHGRMPVESPAVAEFIGGLRDTIHSYGEEVCVVAGVDMAHIGQQFGDDDLLDQERLTSQWTDDQDLLAKACAGDADAWFMHIAKQNDANRICGLAPMYTMLKTIDPERGELLKYDQAVADDDTSCVSFAAAAFYE
ncbi:hypothetical protein Pr1d_16200 [Bythopirellula goksoeyrii]|uniref:AmmeMemoRadiSam system protein B n=2 Tax=Bythopirellula goksoeyrii TaxID=1400387 RepID=A0A5B9Q9Q6_9BACT|nr:hypothetical protein Pr1d_16200 [Bythopirellula goksoeyrii]